MTSNQISYWENEERKRSNVANEALKAEQVKQAWKELSQKDKELMMKNLQTYLQYGRRGDLSLQYGPNKTGWNVIGKNNPSEYALGGTEGIVGFFGDLLKDIMPFDFQVKL